MAQNTFTVDGGGRPVTITIHSENIDDQFNEAAIQFVLGLRKGVPTSHAQRTKWVAYAKLFARTDSVEGIAGWSLPSPDDPDEVIREAYETRHLIPKPVFDQWYGRIYAMDKARNDPALLPPQNLSDEERTDPQSSSAVSNSGNGSTNTSSGARSRPRASHSRTPNSQTSSRNSKTRG